jgi:3D (Asp-Asp-Asp) domain-containing protein
MLWLVHRNKSPSHLATAFSGSGEDRHFNGLTETENRLSRPSAMETVAASPGNVAQYQGGYLRSGFT